MKPHTRCCSWIIRDTTIRVACASVRRAPTATTFGTSVHRPTDRTCGPGARRRSGVSDASADSTHAPAARHLFAPSATRIAGLCARRVDAAAVVAEAEAVFPGAPARPRVRSIDVTVLSRPSRRRRGDGREGAILRKSCNPCEDRPSSPRLSCLKHTWFRYMDRRRRLTSASPVYSPCPYL